MILKLSTASENVAYGGDKGKQGGWWPGTSAQPCWSHSGRRPHDYQWKQRSRDGSFFFSQQTSDLYDENNKIKNKPTLGKTSKTINNNMIFDSSSFNEITSDSDSPAVSPGFENAPEYVACLPLIKI